MERAEFSPQGETEQSGISSDEMGGANGPATMVADISPARKGEYQPLSGSALVGAAQKVIHTYIKIIRQSA